MPETINKISDEAMKRATGKTWREWLRILDHVGARRMSHREIVQLLYEKGYIKSGWWCQMVTVGYEYARGRHVVGQTAAAGFEIGVQKTLPLSPKRAWELLTNPAGRKLWLGTIAHLRFVKGHRYKTKEGTSGEIRSVTPGKHVRLVWHPRRWPRPSTVQVYLMPSGNDVSVRIHQEKLSSKKDRERMRAHWQRVLERLQALAERSRV